MSLAFELDGLWVTVSIIVGMVFAALLAVRIALSVGQRRAKRRTAHILRFLKADQEREDDD